MKTPFSFLSKVLLALLLASRLHAASPKVDFGDMASSTLITSAWKALGSHKYDEAIVLTTKCIETYQKTALEQQKAGASAKPSDKGAWALNDVGGCYFIRAKAYEGLTKNPEAIADYKFLAENLPLTECSGDNGTKWSPAKPAKERAIILAATTKEINTISKIDLNFVVVKTPTAITTYRITTKTQIDFKGNPARLTNLKPGMRVEVTAASDPQVADRISADDPPRK